MIKLEKINKTYDKHSVNNNHVLHDISLSLGDKGFVCVVGPSGCGKTTLVNVIGGLDRFDNGTISTANVSVNSYGTHEMEAERNACFSYIFQNYYLLMDHTVGYNVYLGLHSLHLSEKEKLKRVKKILRAVGMTGYEKRMVSELSGGQQQRVAIARALVKEPKVIFADEPTGNLDEANTLMVCELLRKAAKKSLIVMVTHEERIASVYADRIIRLKDGYVVSDVSEWERNAYTANYDNKLYAEEYKEAKTELAGGLNIRLLSAEGVKPCELTVVVEKDRVVLKISDDRAILLGEEGDAPQLIEGKRPRIERKQEESLPDEGELNHIKTNAKLPFSFCHKEAVRLAFPGKTAHHSGAKSGAIKLFLILLGASFLFLSADLYSIVVMNPKDFTKTDSRILTVEVRRSGSTTGLSTMNPFIDEFLTRLQAAGADFEAMPRVNRRVTLKADLFPQLDNAEYVINYYNYLPTEKLDQSQLIFGALPTKPGEMVIDLWIVEDIMEDDGIVRNSIENAGYLIGKKINISNSNFVGTIVGICDTGEPDIFVSKSSLATLGTAGSDVTSLSELKTMYPGEYDDVVLEKGECLVNVAKAGSSYLNGLHTFHTSCGVTFEMQDTINDRNLYAQAILNDEDFDNLLYNMALASSRFYLYTTNKESVQAAFEEVSILDMEFKLIDEYQEDMDAYSDEAKLQLNARTIIVVSVLAVSLLMIYLFQKSRINERIGMVSVYRLLGISSAQLVGIFAMETFWIFAQSTLPATVLTWGVLKGVSLIEDLNFSFNAPWWLILVVSLAIFVYHLLISILPVIRLLKMPPAQLTTKYDI